MYLIDTSVWIDYFRGNHSTAVKYLEKILDEDLPYGITPLIYMEILQGAASRRDYQQLAEYFNGQYFFSLRDPVQSYEAAARLYFDCRAKGHTVRSTLGCLIAQTAIEHELVLVCHNKDFTYLHKIAPRLHLAIK